MNKKLQLLFSGNQLLYTVFSPDKRSFTFPKKINLQEKLLSNEFSSLAKMYEGYEKLFSCYSELSTLVPNGFYEEENQDSPLSFVSNRDDVEQLEQQIKTINAKLMFDCSYDLVHEVKEHFGVAEVFHHSAVFIETAIRSHQDYSKSGVFVYFFENSMEVVIIKGGKLYFHNTFKVQGKEDVLYYLLFIHDQLNIDKEKSVLILCGLIDQHKSTEDILKNYFLEIQSLTPMNDKIHFPEYKKYFTLYNQYLCV